MGSISHEAPSNPPVVEVDVLISGAGPTGASLACFLGSYGIKGLMISDAPGTAETPRANYTNMAAFECLRDIGLESVCRDVAHTVRGYSSYNRICKSLAGEEILRAYTFGNDPHKHGAYYEASPCETACLPQDRLEPILLQYASQHGFTTRFSTKFLGFRQDNQGKVESKLRDMVTGQEMTVRSRFLCGADGAQSSIARELALPMHQVPGGGLAINLHVEAEMTHLMNTTPGLLHIMIRPDRPQPLWGIAGLAHFIKPWNEWVISLICHPSLQKIDASEAEMMARVRELVEDDSIDIKLKNKTVWKIDDAYAELYSRGNVFCLGDAVHRHPPYGGLGSNTCIQDAFNLAWKLAYVLNGQADESLLSTYNDERQPVGKYVVGRANGNGRLNFALFETLGIFDPDIERRKQVEDLFADDSAAGEDLRQAFRKAVRYLDAERHGLGSEMNQWYKSPAIYDGDEVELPEWPANEHDRAVHHVESTYPGFRVPHAWLGVPKKMLGPRPPLISSRDLCGHGRFTVLTGIGGKAMWAAAAANASKRTGVDVHVFAIGFGQDYTDPFFSWYDKRGVDEKGAILVRPDLAVSWRCKTPPGDLSVCEEKLTAVLCSVLLK